jgi:ankyrin repeat protein
MRAIINGHHNLCYYLINEVKVNISQKDVSNHSAFYFASKNDFLEILEALVNREDDPIPGASLVLQYLVQEETPETN